MNHLTHLHMSKEVEVTKNSKELIYASLDSLIFTAIRKKLLKGILLISLINQAKKKKKFQQSKTSIQKK